MRGPETAAATVRGIRGLSLQGSWPRSAQRWGLLLLALLIGWRPGPACAQTAPFSAGPVWRSFWSQRTTSVALGDLDQDGDLDLVCGNSGQGATRIRFGLPWAAEVTLEVFDVQGARVARLAGGRRYPAGFHTILWDGAVDRGHSASSGLYFCRLTVGHATLTGRLLRIR